MIGRASTDPYTARRLLAVFTVGSRSIAGFYRERQYLIGLSILKGLGIGVRAAGPGAVGWCD